jgi:hypothetical protein
VSPLSQCQSKQGQTEEICDPPRQHCGGTRLATSHIRMSGRVARRPPLLSAESISPVPARPDDHTDKEIKGGGARTPSNLSRLPLHRPDQHRALTPRPRDLTHQRLLPQTDVPGSEPRQPASRECSARERGDCGPRGRQQEPARPQAVDENDNTGADPPLNLRIPTYDDGNGYPVQCADGPWSKSGGIQGACSGHGRVG